QVTFDQQSPFLGGVGKGASKVGGDGTLALSRDRAGDEYLFQRLLSAKIPQADRKQAQRLSGRSLPIGDAHQAALVGERERQRLQLAEELRPLLVGLPGNERMDELYSNFAERIAIGCRRRDFFAGRSSIPRGSNAA